MAEKEATPNNKFDCTKLNTDTTITTLTHQFGANFVGRPNGATLTITNEVRKDPNRSPV